jgi:hypothetical protein
MIAYLFAGFLLFCVLFDWVFMQRSQRRLLKFIAIAFIGAAGLSLAHEHLQFVATLTGVGRPVDLFIYICCALLVRELFLGRARDLEANERLTELVRSLAHKDASKIAPTQTQRT